MDGADRGSVASLCRAQVIGPCASVSLVGRNIRGILHELGEALEFFAEQKIYLVSQAANDLNFTFVVDEDQADRLVEQLHALLIRSGARRPRARSHLGRAVPHTPAATGACANWWWQRRAPSCSPLMGTRDAAYVYDLRHRARERRRDRWG